MTFEEASFVLGSLFGMYAVGWCAGFLILTFKQGMDKI